MAMATRDAPEKIDIPHDSVGQLIGRGGGTLKRLMESTGCKIEIPKRGERGSEDSNSVEVTLEGTATQRRLAATAIKDVLEEAKSDRGSGAEAVEDHAARAEGALVLTHGLNEAWRRRSWLGWRLVPVEFEYGIRADLGRRSVRLWARRGRHMEANRARKAVEAVMAESRKLAELVVSAPVPAGPDGTAPDEHPLDCVNFDAALFPLVENYGVLVNVPRVPEDGRMPITVTGEEGPAHAAAHLLKACYAENKKTASVLQNGQIQSMGPGMLKDFSGDVRNLEQEYKVKINFQNPNLIWMHAVSSDTPQPILDDARQTLMEMLMFYMPGQFSLLTDIGLTAMERLMADEEFRWLRRQPTAAGVFNKKTGTAWLCGNPDQMAAMRKRVEQVLGQWSAEHWEMELESYGTCMWLLGPKGTGEYIGRISAESGARVSCCPNKCKVWADGQPFCVQEAKRLVMEGLSSLKTKKKNNPQKRDGEQQSGGDSSRPRRDNGREVIDNAD